MANPEHVTLLKKGVEYWNEWREENPRVVPDLSGADLEGARLQGADLRQVYLWEAYLREADLWQADLQGAYLQGARLQEADLRCAYLEGARLQEADLRQANLSEAYLQGARLQRADLQGAHLQQADLQGADLEGARLQGVDLKGADLSGANLRQADLQGAGLQDARLQGADLQGADLQQAGLGNTTLVDLDFSQTIGLEKCIHHVNSQLARDTLVQSKGQIPVEFLRGCGLSDWEIESVKLYQPDLSNSEINDIIYKIFDIRSTQAIQINPLFISYTHDDSEFVDKVGDMLTQKGVRFWRDIHHATAGKLERQVDRAMRLHPTVLLVLSKNSTNSDWVEHEAKKARTLEKELERDVICPVALDDSWKTCKWPTRLREQVEEYKILDFSDWQDRSEFEGMFAKLLQGLDLFYKD